MLDTVLLIAIGAFIGWNLPQPFWAKAFQKVAMEKWAKFRNK
jgi:hypothetical protein